MKEELEKYLEELKADNKARASNINSGMLSDYSNTVAVHTYNCTQDVIKKLELIINKDDTKVL